MRQLSVCNSNLLDHEESFIKSKSGEDFASKEDHSYEQNSRRKSSSVKEKKNSAEKTFSNS